MNGWKEYKFDEFVHVNPKVSISKATACSYVEMRDLNTNRKKCFSSIARSFTSGSKFQDGDTLFARITPCLENGKICQVAGLNNGIGCGSTEFLVFRGREKVSNTDFVYYLSRWDDVRAFAEANFDGTSGRQRVPSAAFSNLKLLLPDLPEQRVIASVLSSLDDKIDLLHRQNKTLEAMAETVFRNWFDIADSKTKPCSISDLADHKKASINPNRQPQTMFHHYSIPAYDDGYTPKKELGITIQSNKYIVPDHCILFSKLNPHRDKRIWLVFDKILENSVCSTEFQVLQPKNRDDLFFLFLYLNLSDVYDEIAAGVGGTSGSHQRIDPETIFKYHCYRPDPAYLKHLNRIVQPLFHKRNVNLLQIASLANMRDTLLPKLMSGEVRIKA
jgi:type I restriction enzyme S subunit